MPLNAVERRLVELREHWDRFRNDSAKRVLVWRMMANASRMAECFFETQKFDAEYSSRDLFIVFDQPFEHSIQYSRALKAALKGQYDASREELLKQGIAPDWAFEPNDLPDSAAGFVRGLEMFASKHQNEIEYLVGVLIPSDIANVPAYLAWVRRCLDADIPERLRLLLLDVKDAPRFDALTSQADPRVALDEPPIDALATAQETFAQETTVGPAGVFRNYLMGLVTLVERGSAEQVRAKAVDAVAFVRKHGWQDQEVVLGLMVAGALLKERKCEAAAAEYRAARQIALATVEAGHPAGHKLVLQTMFGEGGALVAAGEWDRAATCYETAAATARKIPEPILVIEAARMGLFCHAKLRRSEAALACGAQALVEARSMEPDARIMSTLAIAAVDMLRVIDPGRVRAMERVKQRETERVAAARHRAEAGAAALEAAPNAQRANDVDESLAREIGAAREASEQELNKVAAEGNESFRNHFEEIRDLLSADWPAALMGAIPAAAAVSETGGHLA
jgi:hypothetical protein